MPEPLTLIKKEKLILHILNIILGVTSLAAIIIIILIFGFYLNENQLNNLTILIRITTLTFILQELVRLFIDFTKDIKNKRILERTLAALLLIHLILQENALDFLASIFPAINIVDVTFTYLGITQLIIIISYLIDFFRDNNIVSRIKIHPGAITAISFATLILIGSLLLYMPKSTPINNPISYVDALFTATSAVCVTGLTTVNIANNFTQTGQVIIIMLIQIGGIGVMTLSSFLAAMLLGGISFRMTLMLKDILNDDNLSEISSALKRISLFTLAFEICGMISLYFSLGGNFFEFDSHNLGIAIFHSISAFCNSGFSTFTSNIMDPALQQNYPFLFTLMILIFFGGIGYVACSNMFGYLIYKKNRMNYSLRRLTLSTRLIFIVSFVMVIGGGLIIFATESYSSEHWMGSFDKFFHSFFMVVSSRTAGFSTVYIDKVNHLTCLIMMIMMWIGGSPGSTGGGVKTTTVGVLFLHFINYLKGKDNLHFRHRRIEPQTIQKAQMVLFSTLIVTIFGFIVLVYLEPKKDFLALMFETISAISTTGMSLSLTASLSSAAKYVVITLMYVGRVGVLSFFFAFFVQRDNPAYDYPDERVIIG